MVIRFSIPARLIKLYYKNCVESIEDKALKIINGETCKRPIIKKSRWQHAIITAIHDCKTTSKTTNVVERSVKKYLFI